MPHTFAIVIGPEVKKSAEGVTDFLTAFYESYVSELREIELVGWDKINELCSFICSYEDEQSDDICKLATTPIGKGPWPELSELMLLCAKEAQVYEYGFTCAKHAVSIISDALETNQLKEIFLTPESPDIVELDNGQERIQLQLTDDQHTLLCKLGSIPRGQVFRKILDTMFSRYYEVHHTSQELKDVYPTIEDLRNALREKGFWYECWILDMLSAEYSEDCLFFGFLGTSANRYNDLENEDNKRRLLESRIDHFRLMLNQLERDLIRQEKYWTQLSQRMEDTGKYPETYEDALVEIVPGFQAPFMVTNAALLKTLNYKKNLEMMVAHTNKALVDITVNIDRFVYKNIFHDYYCGTYRFGFNGVFGAPLMLILNRDIHSIMWNVFLGHLEHHMEDFPELRKRLKEIAIYPF